MIRKDLMFEKMIEHFPRWSDIRKRAKKSLGGQIALSIAEETSELQKAIDDYKKDFFIENYFGKEEEILDIVFRSNIGNVEITNVKLLNPNLTITTSIKDFQKKEVAYYEDGYLYIKNYTEQIEYKVKENTYKAEAEVFHIWNVFDEFAAFVGLTRHYLENNKDLEKRILSVFKDKTNSTEDGLKHALIVELMNIDPSLKKEEIKIEGVTPENLQKQYDEFTTVIDKLAEINRDTYLYKRWDIDPWVYDLKTISYTSHFWNYAIEVYKNGIGKESDLKIGISRPNDTTNAVVRYYVRDDAKLSNVLNKKNLDRVFRFKLRKNQDILNPKESNYMIKASEMIDLTDEDVRFLTAEIRDELSEELVSNYIKLSDAELKDLGVESTDTRFLKPNKKYQLKYYPRSNFSNLKIKKADLCNGNSRRSLLKETTNYGFINGEFQGKAFKFYGDRLKYYSKQDKAKNVENGITIADNETSMSIEAMLNNCAGQEVMYQISCKTDKLQDGYVQSFNFDYLEQENKYSSEVPSNDAKLIIENECNFITFKVVGSAFITGVINGAPIASRTINNDTFSTGQFYNPTDMRIEIISANSTSQLVVQDIKYNKFESNLYLKDDEFIKISEVKYLPNKETSTICFDARAISNQKPVLNFISIGTLSDIEQGIYCTEVFTTKEGDYLDLSNNYALRLTLMPIGDNGEIIYDEEEGYEEEYYPNKSYTLMKGVTKALIPLDLSSFSQVYDVSCNFGTIIQKFDKYYIELMQGGGLTLLNINGLSYFNERATSLLEIFDVNPSQDEKIYVSNLFDGFCIKRKNSEEFKRLCDIDEYKMLFRSGYFKFINLPNTVSPFFKEVYGQRSNTFGFLNDSYNGQISNAYLIVNGAKESVAYNKALLFVGLKDNIDVVDTFHPFLNNNKKYLFSINNTDSNFKVSFSDDAQYAMTLAKKIKISCNMDLEDPNNYEIINKVLDIKTLLNKNIVLEDSYILEDETEVVLKEYVIEAEDGVEINYETINPAIHTIEERPDMYGYDIVYIRDERYNKLSLCNIDQITYIGTVEPISEAMQGNIPSNAYSILSQEGIIVWNDDYVLSEHQKVYIRYTINKPSTITVSDDLLYKEVESVGISDTIEAYSEIYMDNSSFSGMKENEYVDLSDNIYFTESDRIVVDCSNLSFAGKVEPKGIRFVRVREDNAISVQTGYYYIDGTEYYYFANEKNEDIDQTADATFFNIVKENDHLFMSKISTNNIYNSSMSLDSVGQIYVKDFKNPTTLQGISKLKTITACDSFNHWNATGSKLSLSEGLNGLGLKFESEIKDGYGILNISSYVQEDNVLSMYAGSDIVAYLGTANKESKESDLIKREIEMTRDISNNNILKVSFKQNKDKDYYLIVMGNGIVDDIVLYDPNKINTNWEIHKKNVDVLKLGFEEIRPNGFIQRIVVHDNEACVNKGAEMLKDGYVINSSNIHWGYTKIKDYSANSNWEECLFDGCKLQSNYVKATASGGSVETSPIYVGDDKVIKSLVIKVNDLEIDSTQGVRINLFHSNSIDGTYANVSRRLGNSIKIKMEANSSIQKYIKLKIDIPSEKIISNIQVFIEYKSTKESAPLEHIASNGYLLTPIMDSFKKETYELNNFCIDDISNKKDVEFYIRGAKEGDGLNVWTDWKYIQLNDDLKLLNKVKFENYRYFQLKIALKNKDAYAKFKYMDMKVVTN